MNEELAFVLRKALDRYLLAIEQGDLGTDYAALILECSPDEWREEGPGIPRMVIEEAGAIHGLLLASLIYSQEPAIDGDLIHGEIKLPVFEAISRFKKTIFAIADHLES